MKLSGLLPVFGLVLFLFVIAGINLNSVAGYIATADPFYIALSVVFVFLSVLLKVAKWGMVTASCGTGYPLRKLLEAWLVGFAMSMITPARLGDISRAYYIRGGLSSGKALTTVVADRAIDVFTLFALSVLGLSALAVHAGISDVLTAVIFSFAVFILSAAAASRKSFVRKISAPLFRRLVPEHRRGGIRLMFNDFYSGLRMITGNRKRLFMAFSLGIAAWALSTAHRYLAGLSIGMDVGYLTLFLVMPIITLLDTLPISLSGIGTREVSLLFFLSLFGVAAETAVAFSVLLLLLGYVLVGAVGFALWLRNPVRFRSSSS